MDYQGLNNPSHICEETIMKREILKLEKGKYKVITARDATRAEKKLYTKRGK